MHCEIEILKNFEADMTETKIESNKYSIENISIILIGIFVKGTEKILLFRILQQVIAIIFPIIIGIPDSIAFSTIAILI